MSATEMGTMELGLYLQSQTIPWDVEEPYPVVPVAGSRCVSPICAQRLWTQRLARTWLGTAPSPSEEISILGYDQAVEAAMSLDPITGNVTLVTQTWGLMRRSRRNFSQPIPWWLGELVLRYENDSLSQKQRALPWALFSESDHRMAIRPSL